MKTALAVLTRSLSDETPGQNCARYRLAWIKRLTPPLTLIRYNHKAQRWPAHDFYKQLLDVRLDPESSSMRPIFTSSDSEYNLGAVCCSGVNKNNTTVTSWAPIWMSLALFTCRLARVSSGYLFNRMSKLPDEHIYTLPDRTQNLTAYLTQFTHPPSANC